MRSKEESYMTMLEATAIMQHHVSVILQAKAIEAEKTKCWICYHMADAGFADKEDQLKQAIGLHEKVIEVIDGLTRLENGLAKNLKVVLNKDMMDSATGFGGFFGADGGGDDGGST